MSSPDLNGTRIVVATTGVAYGCSGPQSAPRQQWVARVPKGTHIPGLEDVFTTIAENWSLTWYDRGSPALSPGYHDRLTLLGLDVPTFERRPLPKWDASFSGTREDYFDLCSQREAEEAHRVEAYHEQLSVLRDSLLRAHGLHAFAGGNLSWTPWALVHDFSCPCCHIVEETRYGQVRTLRRAADGTLYSAGNVDVDAVLQTADQRGMEALLRTAEVQRMRFSQLRTELAATVKSKRVVAWTDACEDELVELNAAGDAVTFAEWTRREDLRLAWVNTVPPQDLLALAEVHPQLRRRVRELRETDRRAAADAAFAAHLERFEVSPLSREDEQWLGEHLPFAVWC